MKSSTKVAAGAIGALVMSGCYTTTVRSGLPPAPPTIEYDAKWHSGLVVGIAELSGPYDLRKICPNGWADIRTETSFVNGVVELVTSGIYSPQSITVRCTNLPNASPPQPDPNAGSAPRP